MALHAFCTDPDRPICMIRGLDPVLGVNLDLFSSASLVQTCPDHEIEVREQVPLLLNGIALYQIVCIIVFIHMMIITRYY